MMMAMTRSKKKAARAKPSANPKAAASARLLSVYDGQEWLGNILERDGEFVACDVNGKALGTFPAQRQAADAISAGVALSASADCSRSTVPAHRPARSMATPSVAPRRYRGKGRHAA